MHLSYKRSPLDCRYIDNRLFLALVRNQDHLLEVKIIRKYCQTLDVSILKSNLNQGSTA